MVAIVAVRTLRSPPGRLMGVILAPSEADRCRATQIRVPSLADLRDSRPLFRGDESLKRLAQAVH